MRCGDRFIGNGDWTRPQRWEFAIAIACYRSVLLTAQFTGTTACDLHELLGPNFRFGREQISFLKSVNWQVYVAVNYVLEVRGGCERSLCGNSAADVEMNALFGDGARDVAHARCWMSVEAGFKTQTNKTPAAGGGLLSKRNKGASAASRGTNVIFVAEGGAQSVFPAVVVGMKRGAAAAATVPYRWLCSYSRISASTHCTTKTGRSKTLTRVWYSLKQAPNLLQIQIFQNICG